MSPAEAIARRPGVVLALALVVTALAVLPAGRLRLETDLVALLPDGSPAADDYRLFIEHFGGFEKVFILILAPQAADDDAGAGSGEQKEAGLIAAAELLESILAASPEVAGVRSGIEARDEEFFLRYVVPRAPLLMGEPWRDAVRERLEPEAIRARVARMRAALSTPLGGLEAPIMTGDPLGFTEELPGLRAARSSLPLDPLSSTFLSPTGDAALVIVTPARSEIDPEGGRALAAELEAAYARVEQAVATPLRFAAVGGPLYAAQDEALMREDMQRTVTGSAIGCTALLVAAFEGLLVPLAALSSVAVALLWTAGWMSLSMGRIAAVGLGFAAVLIGLGIDYGIHGGARFRQFLLTGSDPGSALGATFRHTGPGILTSAVTTAVAFATLSLAHFRPLRELGQLVAVGILAILLSSATVGAAIIVLGRRPPQRRPGLFWRSAGRVVEALVGFASARPGLTLAATVLVLAPALWGLGRLSLNSELAAIRPVDHPAMEAERLLVEHFALGLDTATVVVPGEDLSQVLERASEISRLVRSAAGPGAEITSPADWLTGKPTEERLRELEALPLGRAAVDLERELEAANLNPRAFARGLDALRALDRGEDPGAPPPAAWPDALAELIRLVPDGTHPEGAWAAVHLRLPEDLWPAGPPAELVDEIKAVAPGSAVASVVSLGNELRSLAHRDLATFGLVALGLVAGVVLVSFRGHVLQSLLAALPVVLGSLWVLGVWGAVGRSLDLLSLSVVPILLGIGIDDGLHALHGARSEATAGGPMPIADAVRGAGRAMVLTTLTTCAGFGSLSFSRVPGLRNGGLLVSIGVLACLLATLLVLPALESLFKRARPETPGPSHG
ncbi:MAG: MMPL family transporter [bacterium]|nr:MMPL family transporter [bacterium]